MTQHDTAGVGVLEARTTTSTDPADASQFIRDSELWFDHGKVCKDDEPVAVDVDERKLGSGEYRHHAAAQPHAHSEPHWSTANR